MDYPIDGLPEVVSYRLLKSSQIYTQNSFLPDQPVKIESTGFIRSQRTAALRFNPFQYNPAAGELRYFPKVIVQVKLPGTGSLRKPALSQADEGIFEDVLKSSLINYDLPGNGESLHLLRTASKPAKHRANYSLQKPLFLSLLIRFLSVIQVFTASHMISCRQPISQSIV